MKRKDMPLIESNPDVLSRVINDDDIYQDLVTCIRNDFQISREPSSYAVQAKALLMREEVTDDEVCVVVALPGHFSPDFPATGNMPDAVVENTPRGRFACVRLRDKRVYVPTYAFGYLPKARLLILYMFDDAMLLDIVPNTEELEEDFWIHEMCSQSHAHPSYEELEAEMGPTNSEDSEFPVIVLTNRTVTARG
jgi:hypothetical protein